MDKIKVFLAQMGSVLGNKKKNLEKIFDIVSKFYDDEYPNIFIFPEMFLTGYGIKELVYKLAEEVPGPSTSKISSFLKEFEKAYVVIGMPEASRRHKGIIYNSAVVINKDGIVKTYRKRHLPTFGVFDESRYFKIGPPEKPRLIQIGKFKVGFIICYDAFFSEMVKAYSLVGADIVGVLSAAPTSSRPLWEPILRARAIENTVFILYTNQVGYQDGLEFYGEATIVSPTGAVVKKGEAFKEMVIEHVINIHDIHMGRQIRPIIKDFNYEDLIMLSNAYNEHMKNID
mgnify:CR=1 FL=1